MILLLITAARWAARLGTLVVASSIMYTLGPRAFLHLLVTVYYSGLVAIVIIRNNYYNNYIRAATNCVPKDVAPRSLRAG